MPRSVTLNRSDVCGLLALPVGELGTNCYLYWDPETLETAIIDPGDEPMRILATLDRLQLHPTCILNTHGHADHIAGNATLHRTTGARLLIHAADGEMLSDPAANLSVTYGPPVVSPPADAWLTPEEVLSFGRCQLRVLATPGHTPGSVCLLGSGLLFSGDTLFALSIGRTDLPGGDPQRLSASLRLLRERVPWDTRVLPGHGPASSMDVECRHNPFLQPGAYL